MGRAGGNFVQRVNRPNGKPLWSPTHAHGARCMMHFPPFPQTKRRESAYNVNPRRWEMCSAVARTELIEGQDQGLLAYQVDR